MIRSILYKILDPPIWYQNAILSLLGEQKLGLEADFGSERHLGAYITLFTLLWILFEITVIAGVLIVLVLWYENSHPTI